MSDFEAIIRWLVVLFAAGLAGLPIAAKLLGDSGRRAIWFARPIGLLAFFFPVWFLSSVVNLPFNRFFLVGSLIVVIAGGWYWYYRSGAFRNLSMREVFVAELVTLSAFLGAVWLRGFTPDIVGTEKPMDMAFLSSVIRSNQMPPPDPWMAGETINYYYIGYAIHGAVAKVAGVSAPIAFNLALVTTTALAIAAAIGCALVIAPRFAKFVAPLAGFFAIIAGNMDGPYRVLREGRSAWDASFGSGMGWQSSRVVYDGTIQTINEFPAFSIILGDLHPHLMTLPFTIVALAVAFGFVRNEGPVGWIQIGLAGVLGGALYGLNSWDLPTFFGLIVLALIWNSRSLPRRDLGLRVVGIGAVALIAWAPFIINFSPPVAGSAASLPSWLEGIPVVESLLTTVSVNNFEFTSAGEFLRVFGLFYALILAALLVAAKRLELTLGGNDAALTLGVPLALLVLIALLGNAPVFILVGVPAVLAVKILARSGPAGVEGAVAALFLAGALIIGLTELFFIQDLFRNRMNTLFKAYYQVWTLWALAAAIGLGWLLATAPRFETRAVVSVAVAGSLVLGLIYPVVAATRWTSEFSGWQGLDGGEFMARFSADEVAGIEFIRANASQESVLLEAPGCSYLPFNQIQFNRVSAFTGVPTVLGWPNHENQWRSGDQALQGQIGPRREAAQAFYNTPTLEFLDRYNIDFVYYGIHEQGRGEDACDWAVELPKPDAEVMANLGFDIVFEQGEVTIWQRAGSG